MGRFDFELQIMVFRSKKCKHLLMQFEYAKSERICFRFENPMAQVARFGPKIQRLG